jgi:hypothetical protein
MMIDRRGFVAGAALIAIAPIRALSTPPPSLHAATMSSTLFMIDGWSVRRDDEATDQVWIRIGHGWRTAWR